MKNMSDNMVIKIIASIKPYKKSVFARLLASIGLVITEIILPLVLARMINQVSYNYCRKDNQVKYRGFRLGLEEIENKIQNYVKDIRDCVVFVRKDGMEEYLTLTYISPKELEVSRFKQYMSQYMPNYEIPTILIRVESMPLNKNGKIDREAVTIMVNKYLMNKYGR